MRLGNRWGAFMFHLTVNGENRVVGDDVDPATPLLLGAARSPRLGRLQISLPCSQSVALAARILDGKAVRSCQLPWAPSPSRAITTIEAIGATPNGAKIQEAWTRSPKCPSRGYCQAGQIMLGRTWGPIAPPNPTILISDAAMAGNICRAGPTTTFAARSGTPPPNRSEHEAAPIAGSAVLAVIRAWRCSLAGADPGAHGIAQRLSQRLLC